MKNRLLCFITVLTSAFILLLTSDSFSISYRKEMTEADIQGIQDIQNVQYTQDVVENTDTVVEVVYVEDIDVMSAGIARLKSISYTPSEIQNLIESRKSDDEVSWESIGEEGKESIGEENNESEDEYCDFAIADVSDFVNVRTEPNTESSIVGRIYAGSVAHVNNVAGEENDWLEIISGNVTGFIKAEYFIFGENAADVIENYVVKKAKVTATRLNVRSGPGTEKERIGYLLTDESVNVLEECDGWLKVEYYEGKTGYISSEYATVSEEYSYAKTMEEIAQKQALDKEYKSRVSTSENKVSENTTIAVTPPGASYDNTSELRKSIVDYANQYLGNKYVNGGQTLAGGTDCSGFTCFIYEEFGYSISRTPGGQYTGAGRAINLSDAQPGDIICYGMDKCTHVGLYIGDNKIIHSANSRKGVIISDINFMTILGARNVID